MSKVDTILVLYMNGLSSSKYYSTVTHAGEPMIEPLIKHLYGVHMESLCLVDRAIKCACFVKLSPLYSYQVENVLNQVTYLGK